MLKKYKITNYADFDPKHVDMTIVLTENQTEYEPDWKYNNFMWYYYNQNQLDPNFLKGNFMDKLGFKNEQDALKAIEFYNKTKTTDVSFFDIINVGKRKYGLLTDDNTNDVIVMMEFKILPRRIPEYKIISGAGGCTLIILSKSKIPSYDDLKCRLKLYGNINKSFQRKWEKIFKI